MPRTIIETAQTIEHLSILDEHGAVDADLEPKIPEGRLRELYRAMLLGRRFDERMLALQRQGRIGTFPPITGQEAAQLGAVFQLRPEDWFVPAFRETAAEIWRGRSLASVILYYNGFNEGTILPQANHDLPMAVPVASQLLHAVGLGYAAAYRRSGEVVMSFFGDGATSEGDFHEALNCAAVYGAPVVFICQNNHWAISVPLHRQTRSATIAQKALAYGMPGLRVDGNDVLAVYAAAGEAVERARRGDGPTLIECVTYRVMMHTTADDPGRYRAEEEVEEWKRRDPLPRFENYLRGRGLLDDAALERLEEEVGEEIRRAVEKAEEQMKEEADPREMFAHLYAEMPPSLRRQQESMLRQRGNAGGEAENG